MNEYAHANTKTLAKDEVPELCALGREERACDEKRRSGGDGEPEVAHVEEPSEGQAGHEDHGVLGVALSGRAKGEWRKESGSTHLQRADPGTGDCEAPQCTIFGGEEGGAYMSEGDMCLNLTCW